VPYGPSFIAKPSLAYSPNVAPQPQSSLNGGAGGYGGYGGYGGGWGDYGGGGGGGGSYADYARQFYNELVNWAINRPDRGG
jgi:hypothetical protein